MAIRISGLVSGLDTESLVSELVSAYSVKKDNYVNHQYIDDIKRHGSE